MKVLTVPEGDVADGNGSFSTHDGILGSRVACDWQDSDGERSESSRFIIFALYKVMGRWKCKDVTTIRYFTLLLLVTILVHSAF